MCSFVCSLITKVFLFQFVNSYIALFYVAFVKGQHAVFGQLQQCDLNDCLGELYVTVAARGYAFVDFDNYDNCVRKKDWRRPCEPVTAMLPECRQRQSFFAHTSTH